LAVVNNLNRTLNIISKKDSGKTLASKIILLAGIFISSIPYGIYFGWLFFIAGIILVWNSDLLNKHKWYWTIIPLLIWYPMMFLFFFLIPTLFF
jgi:hypothetical protein